MDEHEAGRELDALIAEHVMGRRLVRIPTAGPLMKWTQQTIGPGWVESIPPYSTDIAAAWHIVEKLTSTTKQWVTIEQHSAGTTVTFLVIGAGDAQDGEWSGEAETAPLAICRAALEAARTPVPGPRTPPDLERKP